MKVSIVLITIAAALALAGAARGDEIQLLASVRLAPGAHVVCLADVAQLQGEHAASLGDAIIADVPEGDGPFELSLAAVREALEQRGAHWGRLNLSGRSVLVRPHPRAGAGGPEAMQAVSLAPEGEGAAAAPQVLQSAAGLLELATLRGEIARRFLAALAVDPQALRLEFDAADGEVLDRSMTAWRFELAPEGALQSDVATILVRMWREGRVQETASVVVRPLVEVPTAVLTRDLSRDERIGAGDVQTAYQWLSPIPASLCCRPADAVGRLAERSLRAGDVLRSNLVRRETLVERGDRVNVRCLVGGLAIALQAEARDDGSEGDVIEFRKFGERATFRATVVGPHEAVLDLTGSHES